MAKGGKFGDGDPGELVDLLDAKILKRGFPASLFSRVAAVVVRPAGRERGEKPYVWIGRHGLVNRQPTINVTPPDDVPVDAVPQRLAAAGATGGEPRKTFGQLMYDFPIGTGGAELVEFALAAMRALGVQSADGWEYEPQESEGE
jgi:hypothetical protein